MPGLLSQINAKHRKLMKQIAAKTKTIGIKVPPRLYARLADVRDRLGLSGMRAAALRACVAGTYALLEANPDDAFAGYPHAKGDRWEQKSNGSPATTALWVDEVRDGGRVTRLRFSDGTEMKLSEAVRSSWRRVFSTEWDDDKQA